MSGAPGMAGGLPTDRAGRQEVAGEFVLGTLDARMAARVTVAMQADPEWRKAVEEWERLLAPLSSLARPEAPPPDSWERIEARVAPARAARSVRAARWRWVWRIWALGATAAAAGLAALVLVPRPAPSRLMAVLMNDTNTPALMVEMDRRGGLRLNALPAVSGRQLQAPSGQSLQVWGLPVGATAPVSLGVLPHEPGRATVVPAAQARPAPGMLIEISLEPEGGSRTGRPTGPVVFVGRLNTAAPDS
jgi:anti-sigma-K factor RskA